MSIGSSPRLRLYTSPRHYLRVAADYLTGRWRAGREVQQAEETIARMAGTRFAVLTSMARVGIYLALKHTVRPGQKVIVSPYTIADVINMVVCAGGRPVFADLDPDTCNLSAACVARLLAEEENVGAVMVTHFYGLACDVAGIRDACVQRGVPLVEDAAQAFGVSIGGKPVGSFGHGGIFSFGLYKNVNSFYGGAVVTDDEGLARAVRAEVAAMPPMRTSWYLKKVISGLVTDIVTWPPLFRIFTFQIFRYGMLNDVDSINNKLKIDVNPKLIEEVPTEYLVRPTALQARLILPQLPHVPRHTALRRERAQRYRSGLKDIPELRLPPDVPQEQHMYWYFPIQYDDRENLVKFAMRHGRDITLSYHRNCAALPCFAEFARDCPMAQRTADAVIYLPTYPRYSLAEIDRTVAVIRQYFGKA